MPRTRRSPSLRLIRSSPLFWQTREAGRYSRCIARRPRLPNILAGSAGGAVSKFLLKLYVAGSTPRAALAIENLRRICDNDLAGRYDLEIIDVLEHPELAEQDKILATPTLIKQLPPPLRRVIGDLSDSEKVLLGLELRQLPPSEKRSS